MWLPGAGSASEFTGRSHATAMLLLSDSDQSVKLAGKSIFEYGASDSQLADLLAEVVWSACSDKRVLTVDTLSWLAKAVGRTHKMRYAPLLEYCMTKKTDEKTQSYLSLGRAELTQASSELFVGGRIDLSKIRAELTSPNFLLKAAELANRFESRTSYGQSLGEIYLLLGNPDRVGIAAIPSGPIGFRGVTVSGNYVSLELIYQDIGALRFFMKEGGSDWVLHHATSTKGLFWSKYDGCFVSLLDRVGTGNGDQLREIAEHLSTLGALTRLEESAIMTRIERTPDSQDWDLIDGLVVLGKVAMQKGGTDFGRKLALFLIENGNGPQLRGVSEYMIAGDVREQEFFEAAITRVSASRDTQDGYLADGLAWLCKLIQKSGDHRYKATLIEVSKTARHSSLKRYAEWAAGELS
jgi:hypothetical protein